MTMIDDGFKTTIAFSAGTSGIVLADIMKEKTLKPPGIAGGGPTVTTTMRNTTWRTKAPKSLKTLTPAAITVSYDSALIDEIVAMLNTNQSMVITYPDTSTLTFWGWIDNWEPNPHEEGEQATAELVIETSNQNAAGAETAPVYAAD